jgi:hypothetical protein
MLIKVVPYYPDLMRPAQRMNHHLCVAHPERVSPPFRGFETTIGLY